MDSVEEVTFVVSIVVCGTFVAVFVPSVAVVSDAVPGTSVVVDALDSAFVGSVLVVACVEQKVVVDNSFVGVVIFVGTVVCIVVGLPVVGVDVRFSSAVVDFLVVLGANIVVNPDDSSVVGSVVVAACVVDSFVGTSYICVVIVVGIVADVFIAVSSVVVDASVDLLETGVEAIVPSVVVSVVACVLDSVVVVTSVDRVVVGNLYLGVVDVVFNDSAVVLVAILIVN